MNRKGTPSTTSRHFPQIMLVLAFVLANCNLPAAQSSLPEGAVNTAVAATQVFLTMQVINLAPTTPIQPESQQSLPVPPNPNPATATFTLDPSTATPTLTLTPAYPRIRASVDTNCREGPLPDYKIVGALTVGEEVDVYGRNNTNTWWYIQNTRKLGEFCWVWGETTRVTGDTSRLPVLTPSPLPPTQTPTQGLVAYTLTMASLHQCGNKSVATFKVKNTGEVTLQSMEAYAQNLTTNAINSFLSDSPFMPGAMDCPGGASKLAPGEVAYVPVNLGNWPPVDNFDVTITLCSLDGRTGKCVSKTYYVPSP
jgi:hypothetical protein